MKPSFTIYLSILFTSLILWSCGSQTNQEAANEDSIAVNLEEAESMTSVAETEDLLLETMMNTMMYASLGQIASEKASSQEVKDFAAQLSDSSEQVAAKIKELFEAAGGNAPQALGVEHQAKLDSLQDLPPAEFDQAFVNLVVQEHQGDLESMESLKTESDNAIVRGLAAEAENMMRAQLEKAQAVQGETM